MKSVFCKIGRAQTATDPAPMTMIETVVQLKPKSEWRKGMTTQKLKKELQQLVDLPGVTNAWVMPIKTRIDMLATGIKTPVGIKITGPSLTQIQQSGEAIEAILQTVPGTASVIADRAVGGRYITIDIDRKAAARFGLNIKNIQEVVSTAIGGMNITHTIEGRERYPVNMRYPQTDRDSLAKIKALPVVTPTGANISLDEVATISIEDGPALIKSENAQLTGWILVDIEGIDVGTYMEKAKQAIAEKFKLKPGYVLTWSGQYEYMERAKARLKLMGPVTLSIIILLLYLNFKRFQEVLIILLTLPLAFCGGIWLLYLLNYNLSVAVGVGFIALAGVAIEIGVVMLVYLNQAYAELKIQKAHHTLTDNELKEAIITGSVLRVRPIMMTVSAIIAGLIPIMLGSGTGSEVMRRIAAPMVGGMASATVLTLVVLPIVFLEWKRHSRD